MRVELHPEAGTEMRAAALWHGQRRAGLGDDFIHEVSMSIARIEQKPELFPVWPGTHTSSVPIRIVVLDRFPYLIAFESHRDHSVVLAVAPARRRPRYWLRRASDALG